MKKAVLTALFLMVGVNAFAGSSVADKAAAKMKAKDTRTVVKEIENKEGNPCIPEGKSYQVELQVKQAIYDGNKNKIVYSWETVKTINVGLDGSVMEACGE